MVLCDFRAFFPQLSFTTTCCGSRCNTGAVSYIESSVKKASEPSPIPKPPVTFQVLRVKMPESAKPARCVSPIARGVTYQTIPGFSTTGRGNNGELSMEAAVICIQSPVHTSLPFKEKQPSIWLYISTANVLINSHHRPPPLLCLKVREIYDGH